MAFVFINNLLRDKSFTSVENRFITKFMKALPGDAIKVYLYCLYICKNGLTSYTVDDLAHLIEMDPDYIEKNLEVLDSYELIHILSKSPIEIEILDCDNITSKPHKMDTEKHAEFCKSAQAILKSRSISVDEYRDYLSFLDDWGMEDQALIQIIGYCVGLKGDGIGRNYIKKVITSFASDGNITAEQVGLKLASYNKVTPSLIRIFNEIGIRKMPEIEDDKYYKKWTGEMGFTDTAIIACGKQSKSKSVEKIDAQLVELYNNHKFDVIEINNYYKIKNSVIETTKEIAKNLGVYIETPEPYVENYVNKWFDSGYERDALIIIANRCFTKGCKSFEDMNLYIDNLVKYSIIDKDTVQKYIDKEKSDDDLIHQILNSCGLTRNIINGDREKLKLWRTWGFENEMLLLAAERSADKNNPLAYMNGILSAWKAVGIYKKEAIDIQKNHKKNKSDDEWDKSKIENHYSELRHMAEDRAEAAENTCLADPEYRDVQAKISSLSINLAFGDIHDDADVEKINEEIKELDKRKDKILSKYGYTKESLRPQYMCKNCNDTGYDSMGHPCECLIRFIDEK